MDTKHVRKQFCAITIAVIMVASTFTFVGAFTFPNLIPQAEAQGLQLRVSVSEKPEFENHFFGAQIVQVIIDDPGATDPDESTVGLVVLGVTTPRVHLADGLWYSFVAEDQGFGILLDVMTDGLRNNNIAVQDIDGITSPVTIGSPFSYTVSTSADSVVRQITQSAGFTWIEIDQPDLFSILPDPFFETAGVINPDLQIPGNAAAETIAPGVLDGLCTTSEFNPPGATADTDCDWPYIKLVGIEELSTMEVRAGTSASIVLIFDDFADSITAGLDRTTDYPLNAEVINNYVDFMWNINPVEEDSVFFALDRASGTTSRILYQPIAGFNPADTGTENFVDVTTAFTSSPGMEFDERQILELDSEGVSVLRFAFFLDADTIGTAAPVLGQFAESPFTLVSENARLISEFATSAGFVINTDTPLTPTAADLPVIGMFEGDPNVSVFDNTVETAGGRATLFTGVNDRVASFDYFDIIASAPMTTHDGFTSVDREVYDSADRAVFTVTDPDNNLRSRISEEPTGRESGSFIRIGNPFPLMHTAPTAGISNPALDTVVRVWEAAFIFAGDGTVGFDADNLTFGIDDGPGANIFADVNTDSDIDIGTGTGEGEERFMADDDDIVPVTLFDTNRRLATVFTTAGIGGGDTSAIIIDTSIKLDDIDGFVNIQDITGAELLGQVYVDNLLDATTDQRENFVLQTARISEDAAPTNILGRNAAIDAAIDLTTVYDVRLPQYNLINLDLADLVTKVPFGDVVVKIDAVDPACIPLTGTITSAVAFDDTPSACVHASQIVDFSLEQDNDTDTSQATGDDYVGTLPTGTAAGQPWNTLSSTAINVGFDRDPLPSGKRIGVGVFRSLDLVDAADAAVVTAGAHLQDRIRVTILLLAPASPGIPGFVQDEPFEVISQTTHTVIVDIAGVGISFDPAPNPDCGVPALPCVDPPGSPTIVADMQSAVTSPDNIVSRIGSTFSNLVYRLELDEEGSNSSIFTGRADFFTFNQFDTVTEILSDIVLTGDPLKMWLPNRFIPPNRLAFNNIDEDIIQFFREVSATFIYETRDGSLEWDRSSFSFGQDAFLTLTDEDLNRRPDATERYNLPVDSFVFFELGKVRVDTTCVFGATGCFFNNIDATLLETGPNTGTFVSQITMPRTVLTEANVGPNGIGGDADDTAATITQQQDLEANYIDIRDRSSVRQEFDDITNIRTTLGDVVLDRAAYPPGALMYIEIHDNDFNTDVDIRESIDLRQIIITNPTTAASGWGALAEGTQLGLPLDPDCDIATEFVTKVCSNAAPILEITIFQTGVGRLATLLPVGLLGVTETDGVTAAPALDDRFGEGLLMGNGQTEAILPILTRDGLVVTTALETGPNTGIFEFEVQLPGPDFDINAFPITLVDILTTGEVEDPTIDANLPIQVTYTDPADESGETEDEEELATFLFNTARLRTDKLEYGLGEPVDIIVEEPDFNRDSRSIDEISFSILDIITDKFDTEDVEDNNFACVVNEGPSVVLDACDAGNFQQAANLRTNLTVLRESGFNTGVFAVQIEELLESLVDRGEFVELIYEDSTPSGGGAVIRIEYEFLVVEILPEIIFDKEEYTPFDEFIVSIISPDSNQDPDRIETLPRVIISSSSASLGRVSIPETGPNTGIFEEDFDLTPDPDRFPGDLKAVREDGVTVEFRIDEDTVATKSVFINYHVGQTMFDKDAFRISERGVLRVIDPDANRNPDTIDTTVVRFWSTTDRGGLSVVLRETGDRTGIFEEIITFTPDEESTGTRLRVSEGDTITAKFTDNTLPAPAALDADEVFTVEIEELFASALIGAIVPPLERAVASEPELVDSQGMAITDVTAGSQVLIQSEITNSQTKKQPFAYIVQIKDADGVTISLSWVTGELPAKESLKAAQSWIPDEAGDFTVEIFVWESVDNPVALSPVRTTTVSVS